MSIGLKLFLILLLSCSIVATAVCAAFAFQNGYTLAIAIPSGIIAFIMLFILLKDYKIKNGKKTYMWVYRNNPHCSKHPIVLYDWQPSRRADHPREFLRIATNKLPW